MRNSVFSHGSPSARIHLIRQATCSLACVSSSIGTDTPTLSSRQSKQGKQTLARPLVTTLGPGKTPTLAHMSLDSRKMPPDPDDKKPEKSYLTSAVESINPWASSRTSTPTPDKKRNEPRPPPAPSAASRDHSTTPLYGQSFRTYPKDCPPLTVQWFHAVDVRPDARPVAAPPDSVSAGAEAETSARQNRPTSTKGRQAPGPSQEVHRLLTLRLEETRSSLPEAPRGCRG